MRTASVRLAFEFIASVVAALSLVAVLYSDYWRECCRAVDTAIYVLLLPGYLVAMLLGGGSHAMTRFHFYVGVAVQFVVLWVLVRLVVCTLRNQKEGKL